MKNYVLKVLEELKSYDRPYLNIDWDGEEGRVEEFMYLADDRVTFNITVTARAIVDSGDYFNPDHTEIEYDVEAITDLQLWNDETEEFVRLTEEEDNALFQAIEELIKQ